MTIKNTLDVKPKALFVHRTTGFQLSIRGVIIKNIFDRPPSDGLFSIGDIGDMHCMHQPMADIHERKTLKRYILPRVIVQK